ncbi:hypothetical protein AAE02nite_19160 [Adhaeribacter aerolatus]|uniref:Uncharacterized protein n=1 Tax=Adhaeribacter aerolatus TaxID=670289 RepID=A0A512AX03_9BACT|nr:hypothetical protein [Adhaeribacter aerolatus]GEO04252.1 hypothetical protein AAE02nite_19160 [Adhaeribacter aerolatus]
MKHFFDYDLNNPQERMERFQNYPELSKFYIALREELSQEEYEKLYEAEKESFKALTPANSPKKLQWIR